MAYTCAGNSDLKWTWEENKRFENGLVEFPEGTPNRWEMIAAAVGTKTAAEVEENYIILMEDIAPALTPSQLIIDSLLIRLVSNVYKFFQTKNKPHEKLNFVVNCDCQFYFLILKSCQSKYL